MREEETKMKKQKIEAEKVLFFIYLKKNILIIIDIFFHLFLFPLHLIILHHHHQQQQQPNPQERTIAKINAEKLADVSHINDQKKSAETEAEAERQKMIARIKEV